MKGMGRAKGVDLNLNAPGKSLTPSKGVGKAKTQGVFMTMSGDMGVFEGFDLMKNGRWEAGSRGLVQFHYNV